VIADYRAAPKIDPQYAPSLFRHGLAYAAPGKKDLAKADLAVARALHSQIDAHMAPEQITPPSGM